MLIKKASYSGLMCALISIIGLFIVPHCMTATNQMSTISNGAVTGPARIIISSSQLGTVCKGDIVVASMTDASWEAALCLAAGIITDKGGSRLHAALFGKKMGIPVIVGAGNATKTISDGQMVTIDCSKNSYYTENSVVSGTIHKSAGQLPVRAPSTSSSYSSSSAPHIAAHRTVTTHQQINAQGSKNIKELYNKHYNDFEKYVLGLQKKLNRGLSWVGARGVEAGARTIEGYNDFTVACMPISYPFFGKNKSYIAGILKSLSSDKYLYHIEHSIERCKRKPGNLKLLDWISQVSHEEHVKNITLPAGIQKERLMAEPKEYQKIINRVSAEERDALIAVGLFSRYLAEENLLFRS